MMESKIKNKMADGLLQKMKGKLQKRASKDVGEKEIDLSKIITPKEPIVSQNRDGEVEKSRNDGGKREVKEPE